MKNKTFDTTTKAEAVLTALGKTKSKAEICRSIGANVGSLDEWIQKFIEGGTHALERRRPRPQVTHSLYLRRVVAPTRPDDGPSVAVQAN